MPQVPTRFDSGTTSETYFSLNDDSLAGFLSALPVALARVSNPVVIVKAWTLIKDDD